MSNNNKWEALSLRDRAFLIREAVRNGITDIDSIRDTWEHRFDGESSQPTEDDYIAQRAKEKRLEALIHARNRKETIQPYIEKSQKYKESELERLQMFESELDELYRKADLTSKINLSYDEFGVPKITKVIDPKIQNRITVYQDFLNKYKIECSQSHTHGPGCMATVMDDYGKTETWNKRFAQDPRKHGFIEVDQKDILPGDIVQFGDYYRDTETGAKIEWEPVHAMMANTPYHEIPKAVKYNGSDGGSNVRINSSYPVNSWEDNTKAFRFVGDKADSLQWKKEYREKYGHQFSGKGIPYTTDSNNETDSSFIEKLAYNIGSVPSAKDAGEGDFGDILEGVFNAITNRDPYKYDDLKAFLGHPEDYGFKPSSDTRGPQFGDVISKYKNKNIKTYQGNINPFNEYVVTQEDYNKFFDMATKGEIFYSNADGEYFDYYYKGNPDNMLDKDTAHFLHTPYRNDSHDYPIEFVIKDGNLYANAADFYDFSANKGDGLKKRIQARLLTRYGKPYIVRQNMIPVRAIDLPEEFLGLPTLDYKGNSSNMDLTEEQKRARNMHRNLELFEENKLKK